MERCCGLRSAHSTMFRALQSRRVVAVRAASTSRKRATEPSPRRNNKRILAAIAATDVATTAQRELDASASQLRVLGLDINTNSTGYAVLRGDGSVATWGHVNTSHLKSSEILDIGRAITEELRSVHSSTTASTWLVGIEDFMRMYRFGKFNNKGIFQLAQLNGIVSYTCFEQFGSRPLHTHPTAARGFFGIATGTGKASSDLSVKDQVMAFVLQREGEASSAVQRLRAKHTNRFGQWTDAAFDVADAYVVAAFTRYAALQRTLASDPRLLEQFRRQYAPAQSGEQQLQDKPKSKLTAEEAALSGMPPARRSAYLSDLYVHGVSEWLRQQQQQGRQRAPVDD